MLELDDIEEGRRAMSRDTKPVIRYAILAAGLAVVAACTAAPPPPPPPPPPPAPPSAPVIPPRPQPPGGATASMIVPTVGPDGVRQTVNANLSTAQTTWNLRSALNVAALNCLKPQHAAILPAYKDFLKTHARKLSSTNTALQGEFRKRYGATYRDVQDSYMTQVYNYFALPPVLNDFCDTALSIATAVPVSSKEDLDLYAFGAMQRLEAVYEGFFRSYEQYRVNLTAWDAQYGVTAQAIQPLPAGSMSTTVATPLLPTSGPLFQSGEALQSRPASAPDGGR